jgi:hypothetical protein
MFLSSVVMRLLAQLGLGLLLVGRMDIITSFLLQILFMPHLLKMRMRMRMKMITLIRDLSNNFKQSDKKNKQTSKDIKDKT